MSAVLLLLYPFINESSGSDTYDFRLGARKGILIKISDQKQDFGLFFIEFWAPWLKNLGAYAPGKV